MHDELQEQPSTEQPNAVQPSAELNGQAEANALGTPSAPDTSDPDAAPADPAREKTAPAATASSYRDIIAERLARKSGEKSTTSPMAFTSDVERKPSQAVAVPAERAMSSHLPSEIEASTAQQEIPAAEALPQGENLSSRERARLRQQERAALRRKGPRTREAMSETTAEDPTEESALTEGPIAKPKARAEKQQDVIASRIHRRGDATRGETKHSETERAEGPGEDRSEAERAEERGKAERAETGRGDRRQREPRPERPREPRTERESRSEREPRLERPLEPRKREVPETPILKASEGKERMIRPAIPSRPHRAELASTPAEKTPEEARTLGMKLGISVVIPLFNEQDSLRELTAALKQQLLSLAGPKYEILFVNDGSTDNSGEILRDLLVTSSRVSVISFRRNLGKSAALAAGFAEAQYGIVITMDADLQDDPREFVNLIAKLAEGYDLVSGWKKQRHDPISKTGPSKFFNRVTSLFSGIKLHDFNCGLKAYRKQVTDNLQVYGELHRYLPALAYWQGFRVTEIPVTHHPRKFGKSKFGSSRFFKGFLDLLSIVFTNRYGKRPLHLFGTVGTLMAIVGFIIDVWLTVEWALGMTSLSNRPILLLGLLLILVGVQLISIGLLGEMIVKYGAAKQLPSYTKEKGHASAEARERRANRTGRPPFRRPNK